MGYLTHSLTLQIFPGPGLFFSYNTEDVKGKMNVPKTTCPFRLIYAERAMCGKKEAIKTMGNFYFSFNLVSSLHFVHIVKQLKHNPSSSSQRKTVIFQYIKRSI